MKLRILVSYHYYKAADLDRLVAAFSEPPEIFADSGAYTARSLGVDITVDEYAAWLHRWRHLFAAYASLDVGGPDGSWDKQQALLSLGLRPVPVFHTGEDFQYLQRYLDGYDYIALGGVAGGNFTSAVVLRWAVKAFKMAQATGAVYHGFGQTNQLVMKNLPWYTVDSSSWGAGHRYGTLVLWDGRKGKFVHVPFHDHKAAYTNGSLIRAHGGEPAAVARKDFCVRALQSEETYRADRRMAVAMNVTAWLHLEKWLQARHGTVVLPNRAQGPKVYLAAGGTFSEGDRSHLAEASQGPKIYMANDRNYDLTKASTGPKIYLADARPGMIEGGDLQLADGGPKIYLAEGSWEAHAADVSTALEP